MATNRSSNRMASHADRQNATPCSAPEGWTCCGPTSSRRFTVLANSVTGMPKDSEMDAAAAAASISESFGIPVTEFARTVNRLLEVGPQHVHPSGAEQGVAFWRSAWDAIRLEERFVAIQSILDAPLPAGLKPALLENFVAQVVSNQRFQLSSAAVESFLNTVPLLHPRGYLQVQDIFVTKLEDYGRMFRGPGKLDGSTVNWVNGALLAQVGAQAGYDVHFAPFQYRPGSRTSILYTTHRE